MNLFPSIRKMTARRRYLRNFFFMALGAALAGLAGLFWAAGTPSVSPSAQEEAAMSQDTTPLEKSPIHPGARVAVFAAG